jgi:hypothetical protein
MKYVRITKFAQDTGYTEKAVRRKIEEGVWLEGLHFRRAPDGTIHINIEVYTQWVEGSLMGVSEQRVTG